MNRKPGTLVHYKTSPLTILVNLDGKLHAHRCQRAGHRYADNCQDSKHDGVCAPCRMGTGRPVWVLGAEPVACCVEHSQLATIEERRLYRLGGQSTWFICRKCSRTHPYNPQEGNAHGKQ